MPPVDQFAVSLAEAREPLVLALDVGSTATRGALYDASGRPAGKRAKLARAFITDTDGTSQIDPDQVCDEIEALLDRLPVSIPGVTSPAWP